MPILDRESLEQSPLADLHAIASELSIDGYRRLRKPQLIEVILERQGGESADAPPEEDGESKTRPRRRSRRRKSAEPEEEPEAAEEVEEQVEPTRAADEPVEGTVELLPNGSGFVRVNPPDPSDDDVYISSAQVRRCELVTGDRVSGPRRAPRRSERFAALVRVDTINGRPASELADSARYDDLPAAFPGERFQVGKDADPTVQAVLSATPMGRGSRVTIAGPAQSGKTELARRLAAALAGEEGLQVWVALAGVRPEELADWQQGPVAPAVGLGLGASQDAQAQAVDGAVEQARRLAARGAHALVVIDSVAGLPEHVARRALASARRLENGSLTVVATATEPLGGETTVVTLDRALARKGKFPALDSERSWTMRADLLSG